MVTKTHCERDQFVIRDFDKMTKVTANSTVKLQRTFSGLNSDKQCESCADCSNGICGLDYKKIPRYACAALTRQDCGNCGGFDDCTNEDKKKGTAFRCDKYKVFVHIRE